ncbi:MAG: hypothetical protein ACFFCS_17910 [Candidatus Hodarchaeota archaeon]
MPLDDTFWDTEKRFEKLKAIIAGFADQEEINIVFMCILNCSRSPYGELYFEKLVKDNLDCHEKFKISSRGVIPYEEIHEFTKAALKEKGVTEDRLSKFKPTTIKRKNDEKLDLADLIFVTSKRMIEILIPKKYREKTFMMSECTGNGLVDIQDFAQVTDYTVYKEHLATLDLYLDALLNLVKSSMEC